MAYAKPLFSVGDYDFEGDLTEEGVFIHIRQTRIKVCDKAEEFEHFVKALEEMIEPIKEAEDDQN